MWQHTSFVQILGPAVVDRISKKCLTIYVGIYHFHETMGYVIMYNQQHMRKNLQSKIIFIKTLDISTSVENTTFIKYALIS